MDTKALREEMIVHLWCANEEHSTGFNSQYQCYMQNNWRDGIREENICIDALQNYWKEFLTSLAYDIDSSTCFIMLTGW